MAFWEAAELLERVKQARATGDPALETLEALFRDASHEVFRLRAELHPPGAAARAPTLDLDAHRRAYWMARTAREWRLASLELLLSLAALAGDDDFAARTSPLGLAIALGDDQLCAIAPKAEPWRSLALVTDHGASCEWLLARPMLEALLASLEGSPKPPRLTRKGRAPPVPPCTQTPKPRASARRGQPPRTLARPQRPR